MNELLNGLIKLEKEHGMLGTIIGILILVIVTDINLAQYHCFVN